MFSMAFGCSFGTVDNTLHAFDALHVHVFSPASSLVELLTAKSCNDTSARTEHLNTAGAINRGAVKVPAIAHPKSVAPSRRAIRKETS